MVNIVAAFRSGNPLLPHFRAMKKRLMVLAARP